MEKRLICWNQVLKRSLYSVSFLLVSSLYTVFNKYTGRERELTTYIDRLIPFNKYFIIPYVLWYLYVAIFMVYYCIYNEKKYFKILTAINLGMLISYAIYFVYPTTVPRPVFDAGSGLIGWLFKWLYSRDNPYNCFPSIHVINTLIIAIYVQRDVHFNKYIKAVSVITACAIIYSTMAIKQHVVADVISASGIACALYAIMDYRELLTRFKSFKRVPES